MHHVDLVKLRVGAKNLELADRFCTCPSFQGLKRSCKLQVLSMKSHEAMQTADRQALQVALARSEEDKSLLRHAYDHLVLQMVHAVPSQQLLDTRGGQQPPQNATPGALSSTTPVPQTDVLGAQQPLHIPKTPDPDARPAVLPRPWQEGSPPALVLPAAGPVPVPPPRPSISGTPVRGQGGEGEEGSEVEVTPTPSVQNMGRQQGGASSASPAVSPGSVADDTVIVGEAM